MELRGGFVGCGNTPTAPRGQLLVHRRRERLGPPAAFNARTGAGYVSPKEGDCARAEAMGVPRREACRWRPTHERCPRGAARGRTLGGPRGVGELIQGPRRAMRLFCTALRD